MSQSPPKEIEQRRQNDGAGEMDQRNGQAELTSDQQKEQSQDHDFDYSGAVHLRALAVRWHVGSVCFQPDTPCFWVSYLNESAIRAL